MDVSVGKHWEDFIDSLVRQGRYASATEVMREGLRLVEEREAKLRSLRETIEASIAEGGGTLRRGGRRRTARPCRIAQKVALNA